MEISLNNQPKEIISSCSVQQLLDEIAPDKQKGLAIAINQTVIPKSAWATHVLQVNDDVLLIRATQGG